MGETVLRAVGLTRRYGAVQALDGVGVELPAETTLAVVGPSGSGKSTLARCLAGIEKPDSGEVWRPVPVQLVFQDAAATLNPRFTAAEIVGEPLTIRRRGTPAQRQKLVFDLMEQAGIARQAAGRRPDGFSGGERQRLALARALALDPRVLILDEALSGLDLSVQAQMVNLLADLQRCRGLAYVLITHDIALAGHMADQLAVMHRGRVVESGAPADVCAHPSHEQTRALLRALAG